MKRTITYTHKGWFGLCPVYVGNLDGGAVELEARHWTLEWLFDLSEIILGICFACNALIDPHFDAMWPIKLTGKLGTPRVIEAEQED